MNTLEKTDKICISKSITIFALGGLAVIGFIVCTTLIGKTTTSSNTRAANPQCIYETMQECKTDRCTGLCTKGGCSGGMLYQCKTVTAAPTVATAQVFGGKSIFSDYLNSASAKAGSCQPKDSEVVRTSDGQCWSLRSLVKKLENSPKQQELFPGIGSQTVACYHEKTDASKCSNDAYCKGYTQYLPLVEAYVDEGQDANGKSINCYAAGIRTSISNLGNEGCGLEKVSDRMCSLSYSCNSRAMYKVIDNSCFHLSWRKCTSDDLGAYVRNLRRGSSTNTCCSDKVDMSFCK